MNAMPLLVKRLLAIGLFLIPSSAPAQDVLTADQCVYASDVVIASLALTLRGLPGVRVMVSDHFRTGQDTPLADSLRIEIARILKREGIRVFSLAEASKVPGHPTLHFSAAGAVALEMKEDARLERLPDVGTSVVNYRIDTSYDVHYVIQPERAPPMQYADSIRTLKENRRKTCEEQEREAIHYLAAELTGMFAQAYRQVNPRLTTKKKPPR